MDYPPTGNHYISYVAVGRGVRAFLTAEAKAYKQNVAYRLKGMQPWPRLVALRMIANIYRPRAVGDADNTLKVLQDSLQGFVYENDSQLQEIHLYLLDDEKGSPRVELTFEVINP